MTLRASLTGLRKVLGRIRRQFALDAFDVFTRQVAPEHREFSAPDGYRFAWATPEDIAGCELEHTELDERDRELGVERLGIDHRCVVAKAGERVVFSMWMNPRNLNVPGEVKRRLGSHQAFIYKAYTSPDHRGRRLYIAGMAFVLAHLAREGKTELVGYAHVKKQISRKGLDALGFGSAGRYHSWKVLGWQHTFVSATLSARFPEVVARSQPKQTPR